MLKLGAFENSLRGGPDVSPSVSGGMTKQNHHKSCTGDHHGSGIEKWKRMQGRKPNHHHHHHRHRNAAFSHHTRSTSQCSAASLDCSDTDSGQESLTSPLRATKIAHQSQRIFNTDDLTTCEPNNECFSCDSHINKTSYRLYSTPTKSSAAKTAFHDNGHFDEDEIDVGKMAERECCVIPKNDNYGVEDLTNNGSTSLRRQSVKTLALEGGENSNNRLSTRRKKRNERVNEHVEGSPCGLPLKTGGAEEEHVRMSQPVKKLSYNPKNYQDSITEDKNIDDQHIRRSLSTRYSVNRKASVKSSAACGTEDNVSVNGKNHDKDYRRTTSVRSLFNHVNGKSSQENVLENGSNKAGRSHTPALKSSKFVNGRLNHEPGSPLKSDVSNGRVWRSPGPKKPVAGGRRPPTGSKKFSGVCKVSWSEIAETALITKPNSHLTTGRNGLYKDLNQLLEHSRTLPAGDEVSALLFYPPRSDTIRSEVKCLRFDFVRDSSVGFSDQDTDSTTVTLWFDSGQGNGGFFRLS